MTQDKTTLQFLFCEVCLLSPPRKSFSSPLYTSTRDHLPEMTRESREILFLSHCCCLESSWPPSYRSIQLGKEKGDDTMHGSDSVKSKLDVGKYK